MHGTAGRRDGIAGLAGLAALALAALLVTGSIAPVGAQTGDSAWPTYVADAQNTWRSQQAGPADPGLRWYRDFSEPRPAEVAFAPEGYSLAVGSRHRGMPIEVDDLLVMRAVNNAPQHDENANSVIGVDKADGTVRWEIPNAFAQMGACEPAVDSQGRLWVPSWQGGITAGFDGIAAYDLDDGARIAGSYLERDGVCGGTSLHIAGTGADERLIVYGSGGNPDNFFALDVSGPTPTVAWELAVLDVDEVAGVPNWGTGGSARSIPRPGVATADSLIIPVHSGGQVDLLEVDLATGAERSRSPMPVPLFDPEFDDAQIDAADYDRWQLMMADADTLVVGPWDNGASQGPDAFVAAFDVSNGLSSPTWFHRVPGDDVPGRLALGDGVVLVQPGGRGPIHGLDIATGEAV